MTNDILYSFRRCPYAIRVRWALLICEIKVEIREIDLKNKPLDFLNKSNIYNIRHHRIIYYGIENIKKDLTVNPYVVGDFGNGNEKRFSLYMESPNSCVRRACCGAGPWLRCWSAAVTASERPSSHLPWGCC